MRAVDVVAEESGRRAHGAQSAGIKAENDLTAHVGREALVGEGGGVSHSGGEGSVYGRVRLPTEKTAKTALGCYNRLGIKIECPEMFL